MNSVSAQGDPEENQSTAEVVTFGERDARMILLVQALEEEPDQDQIPRERFDEATRIFAGSMGKGGPGDAPSWAVEFLKPRAEWLYRSLVADHQVYRHFVDPYPFRKAVLWTLFVLSVALSLLADRWIYRGHVEVVSPLVLGLLILTWGTLAWSAYRFSASRPPDTIQSFFSRVATWLARMFHRLPGARPVSAIIVTRFEDLWLRRAASLVGLRFRLGLQAVGAGAIVGALGALMLVGTFASLPVHWGTTVFEDEEGPNYRVFRTITLPGEVANRLLGGEPMSREEFMSLKVSVDGPKVAGNQQRRATVKKWFRLTILTLLAGALLPRGVFALYLWRRERVLSRSIGLDLSDRYFQELRRQTAARLTRSGHPSSPPPALPKRCVWWKPWTWFRRRRAV